MVLAEMNEENSGTGVYSLRQPDYEMMWVDCGKKAGGAYSRPTQIP